MTQSITRIGPPRFRPGACVHWCRGLSGKRVHGTILAVSAVAQWPLRSGGVGWALWQLYECRSVAGDDWVVPEGDLELETP